MAVGRTTGDLAFAEMHELRVEVRAQDATMSGWLGECGRFGKLLQTIETYVTIFLVPWKTCRLQ
eukprot:2105801-Pleurochrysis_carterae.AAC.3